LLVYEAATFRHFGHGNQINTYVAAVVLAILSNRSLAVECGGTDVLGCPEGREGGCLQCIFQPLSGPLARLDGSACADLPGYGAMERLGGDDLRREYSRKWSSVKRLNADGGLGELLDRFGVPREAHESIAAALEERGMTAFWESVMRYFLPHALKLQPWVRQELRPYLKVSLLAFCGSRAVVPTPLL
jgi:hypothetical protein